MSSDADAALWEQEVAADDEAAPLPPMRQALEAVLLVVETPVPEVTLAQVLERPTDAVVAELEALAREYDEQERGFVLRQVAGGWRLYTRPECAPYVERFVRDGQQTRLTSAALETLAIVANRQPVSRGRISAVRGVNVDGVMRTLISRGLIEEDGADAESGALLYRTTPYFLERLGLSCLDELPRPGAAVAGDGQDRSTRATEPQTCAAYVRPSARRPTARACACRRCSPRRASAAGVRARS